MDITLLSGLAVEDTDTPVNVQLTTDVPKKWILTDAEDGTVYTLDQDGNLNLRKEGNMEALNLICAMFPEE